MVRNFRYVFQLHFSELNELRQFFILIPYKVYVCDTIAVSDLKEKIYAQNKAVNLLILVTDVQTSENATFLTYFSVCKYACHKRCCLKTTAKCSKKVRSYHL